MKSFDRREPKIRAPEVRQKKALNTRSILEDALDEDYFNDEDEEIHTDSDNEAAE